MTINAHRGMGFEVCINGTFVFFIVNMFIFRVFTEMTPNDAEFEGALMLDTQTANRWGARPGFVQTMQHWRWCREALPPLMQALARGVEPGSSPPIDTPALARAFWSWAAVLDSNAPLEALDPVDYAHFQAGMLLSELLRHRPLRLPDADRSAEVRVATDTALTLLAAWRQALGHAGLDEALQPGPAACWSSYVENVSEDPGVAVAFLDLFTGREPVWRFPSVPTERPPLRRALAQRRAVD